jgi:cytochrome c biogenesis protein CcmG/thiol:disulfide interchange protein DsbE
LSATASSTRSVRRIILLTLGIGMLALLIALLAYGVSKETPGTSIDTSLEEGRPVAAPPFSLTVLDPGNLGASFPGRVDSELHRRAVSLRELLGTPLALNFYASWCVTCQAEAPTIQQVWRSQARSHGVLLLGVDIQDATVDARRYIHHYAIGYPNLRDPAGELAQRYQVTGVPETFFIDAQGQIVAHIIGAASRQQLTAGIAEARTGKVRGADIGEGGLQHPLG